MKNTLGILCVAVCLLVACSARDVTPTVSSANAAALHARTTSTATPSPTPTPATQASLQFTIPSYGANPCAYGAGFIASYTASIAASINGVAQPAVTVSSPTVSTAFAAPAGNDAFTIVLRDVSQRTLATAKFSQSIPPYATTPLKPTFLGAAAAGSLALDRPYPVTGQATKLHLGLTAYDADRDKISCGSYATPVGVRITGAGNAIVPSPNSFQTAGQTIDLAYNGALVGPVSVAPLLPGSQSISINVDPYQLVGPTRGLLYWLVPGKSGDVWFAECGNACWIGNASSSGLLTYVNHRFASLDAVAFGSDANVWFTGGEGVRLKPGRPEIGMVNGTGAIKYFYLGPTQTGGTYDVSAIVAGPDGRLWFNYSGKIGAITTSGTISTYSTNARALSQGQNELVVGPGNRLHYVDATTNHLCSITMAGVSSCYAFVASPLVAYGDLLFVHGQNGLEVLDSAGHVTPVSTLGFTPLVATSGTGLWGVDNSTPISVGLAKLNYAAGTLTGLTFPETPTEQRFGRIVDRAVYASDGHIWAHGALELSLGDYLLRLRPKT